jgi:hypothetical protein
MRRGFSKIFTGLDFNLLQDQKMTLINLRSSISDISNSSTEKEQIDHLEGVINLLDRILDKAEDDALWNFKEWANSRNFDLNDREVVKD